MILLISNIQINSKDGGGREIVTALGKCNILSTHFLHLLSKHAAPGQTSVRWLIVSVPKGARKQTVNEAQRVLERGTGTGLAIFFQNPEPHWCS